VRRAAEARGLNVFDATCPLVTKVHIEVKKMREKGLEIVMIGHKGHPEVEGTMGQAEAGSDGPGMYLVETPEDVAVLKVRDPEKLAFVTQTTLSMDDAARVIDALRSRFPKIIGPKKDDICYATQNRQDAVKKLSADCDLVLVVGSPNSSNSNRLREVAANSGIEAYMVDNAGQIEPAWLDGKQRIGLTAGASAPEVLVSGVIDRLKELGIDQVEQLAGIEETTQFPLPSRLAGAGQP
jgi:4-hydroxy-3-methylbut-2-enyl diphosphate reductase